MTALKKTNATKPDDRATPEHMEVEGHLLLPSLSQNEITILAETFRLLGDPSRLKILLSCVPAPISIAKASRSSTRSPTSTSAMFFRIWRRIFQRIMRTTDPPGEEHNFTTNT